MKRSLRLAVVALPMFAAAPFIDLSVTSVSAQATTAEAATQSASFSVKNMTCALCPVTVRRAMASVEGVRSVAIDFEAKTANVVFVASITNAEAIAAASASAGYPAAPQD